MEYFILFLTLVGVYLNGRLDARHAAYFGKESPLFLAFSAAVILFTTFVWGSR